MPLLATVFALVAVLVRILSFTMESLLWMKPRIHKRFGIARLEDASTLKNLMFNQGFYNLFVAIGCLYLF